MAFVVEDGTGLTTATSYLSVADAGTILEQNPDRESWKCRTDQEREVCLRFATTYMDLKYRWFGNVTNPGGPQALQWGRTKVFDRFGTIIGPSVVPDQLERAVAFVALQVAKAATIASGAEDLTATVEASGSIKSFQIETLSITFDQGATIDGGGIMREFLGKRFPEVELLLHSIGELRGMDDLFEQLG